MKFIHSIQSEWLKTRRSAASWLCLAGGCFLPLLFLAGFLLKHSDLNSISGGNAWLILASQLWHFMGILFLPVGIVLAASLLLQIEHRNNAWKQLMTMPQSDASTFSAKLLILLFMTLKFFIFFNLAMLVAGILPTLLFSHRMPDASFPVNEILRLNLKFFVAALPMLLLQFLLSLLFRNFLVSVGIGLLMIITALVLVETGTYAWLNPYCFCPILILLPHKTIAPVSIYWISAFYSGIFIGLAYLLFRFRKVRG